MPRRRLYDLILASASSVASFYSLSIAELLLSPPELLRWLRLKAPRIPHNRYFLPNFSRPASIFIEFLSHLYSYPQSYSSPSHTDCRSTVEFRLPFRHFVEKRRGAEHKDSLMQHALPIIVWLADSQCRTHLRFIYTAACSHDISSMPIIMAHSSPPHHVITTLHIAGRASCASKRRYAE